MSGQAQPREDRGPYKWVLDKSQWALFVEEYGEEWVKTNCLLISKTPITVAK